MKILVCFKVLPNPDGILEEDYESFSLSTDLSYAGYDYNCFDASALEIGLKIKEQSAVWGVNATCTALSVSNRISPKYSQSLYSVGYDNVVNLKLQNREFKPKEIGRLISEYAKEIGADIVLTGAVAGFAETGMVPYYISNNLGYPIVSDVENAEFKDGLLECNIRRIDGLSSEKYKAPVVVSVNNSPEVLRFATLKARMACRNMTADEIEAENGDSILETPILSRPCAKRECTYLDEKDKASLSYIENIIKLTDSKEKKEAQKENTEENSVNSYLDNVILIDNGNRYYSDLEEISNVIKNENKKLLLLLDNNENRKLAITLSNKMDAKCFFCGKIEKINENSVKISKRVCASNLLWQKDLEFPAIVTVNDNEFKKLKGISEFNVEKFTSENNSYAVSTELIEKTDSSNLKNANIVLICGAGAGDKNTVDRARLIAEKYNMGFGLTRPASLNAWGSPIEIIGQSGSIISPDLCIVIGAAGAGAFMLGIENAKKIVAVNTDSNALIFKNADVGLKMDAKEFIEGMLSL